MKKLFVTASLIFATFGMAQENAKPEKNMRNLEQMKQKQEDHLQKMQKDLNLSSAQVQQIKSLQDKHFSEMQANKEKAMADRAKKMQEMKTKKEAHDTEMKRILSPEQYQKWEKQRDENMKMRRDRWKENGGKRNFKKENKEMKTSDVPSPVN